MYEAGVPWHTYGSPNSKRVKCWPGPYYIFPIAILLSDAIPSDTTRAAVWPISPRATTGDRAANVWYSTWWTPLRPCATLTSFFFFEILVATTVSKTVGSHESLCVEEWVWSTIERRKLRFKKLGNIEADTKRKIGSSTYRVIFRLLVQYYIILKS